MPGHTSQISTPTAMQGLSHQPNYIDTIDLAIAIYDRNQCLDLCNRQMRKWWKFDRAYVATRPHITRVIQRNFKLGLYDFPANQIDSYIADRLARMRSGKQQDLIIKRGKDKIFNFSIVPLDDGACMFTFFDITELKHQQRELLAQRRQLVENETRYRSLYATAQANHRELLLLDKLNSAIASKLDPDELSRTATEAIRALFEYDDVEIHQRKNTPETFEACCASAVSALICHSFQSGEPLLKHFDASNEDTDYCSALAIPLLDEERVIAVLSIANCRHHLRDNDRQLMTKVGAQLSIALTNAKLHQQIKNDLTRSRFMLQLSRDISCVSDVQVMLRSAIETIVCVVGSSTVTIHQVLNNTTRVKTHHGRNAPATNLAPHHSVYQVIEQHKSIESTETTHPAEPVEQLCNSRFCVPLFQESEIWGVLDTSRDDGNGFSDSEKNLLASIANQLSLAIQRHTLTSQVEHMAYHDDLTGLPNRRLFESHLESDLRNMDRSDNRLAVLFVDVDGFKNVNDKFGHTTGDAMLIEFSRLLRETTRSGDTLVRVGGDEFAVITRAIDKPEDALAVADRYLKAMDTELQVAGHCINVGASIGISFYPKDGSSVDELLRHADSAMYQAKSEGKNTVRVYSPYLAAQRRERTNTEYALRHALHNREFSLHYQPQIDVTSGDTIGMEALLRWHHPQRGIVSPQSFIPVAEQTGMIIPISEWVLREACEFAVRLQKRSQPGMRIAVNISAVQFEMKNFVDLVDDVLTSTTLAPGCLEFEVTESVVMQDIDKVIQRLKRLRDLGISIAIDDFGTGYSSLQYVQQLPLDALKIDRAFVAALDCQRPQKSLINSIIALARVADLRTVAEGIEQPQQLQALQKMGCDEAQGYLISKPLPASEVLKSVRKDPAATLAVA